MDNWDVLSKIKQVYELLEDECSKEVYLNRLNFLITGKQTYIDHILSACNPKLGMIMGDKKLYEVISKKYPGKEIILYGAGADAKRNIDFWNHITEFSYFCDSDLKKQQQVIFGKQVISPHELFTSHADGVVIISSSRYEGKIKEFLLKNHWDRNRLFSLKEYTVMYDAEQYFAHDIIQFDEQEIFVDGGSFNLSTSLELSIRCPGLKKVFAFEPDKENYQKCLAEIEKFRSATVKVYPNGLWDKSGKLSFHSTGDGRSKIEKQGENIIESVALDETIHEKITFIKMDIEGAELEALQGASSLIRQYKPKLAICIYHKEEDLVDIPLYIKKLVPEYKLFARHYSTVAEETVLYAV